MPLPAPFGLTPSWRGNLPKKNSGDERAQVMQEQCFAGGPHPVRRSFNPKDRSLEASAFVGKLFYG